MIRFFVFVAFASTAVNAFAADRPQCAPAEPAGMARIFNGTDLTGWDGDPELWSVRDFASHSRPRLGGNPGLAHQ